ncbi:MAG TPA: hypothetical protein VEC19_15775 [Usitatibacter sp.]|nr:hypothetical protein [Usitatibacter sp.]
MIRLEYLSLPLARARLGDAPAGLLAMLGFPLMPAEAAPDLPSASVGLAEPQLPAPICEVWTGQAPVVRGSRGRTRYTVAGELLFGVLSLAESEGPIRDRAQRAYAEIFSLIEALGHPHVLRFWNYFPRINDEEDGLERYRLFTLGRYAAFEAVDRVHPESIPAACALGTHDDALTVYFVASRHPGLRVENPRQVNAWQYPREYGPKSPTFARAVLYPATDPSTLFVSGTASIVGHRTLHAGDVAAQSRETVANLEALFGEAERIAGIGSFPLRAASFKVYVRHAEDTAIVKQELAKLLGPADMNFLRADICRADLLMEIEAMASRER